MIRSQDTIYKQQYFFHSLVLLQKLISLLKLATYENLYYFLCNRGSTYLNRTRRGLCNIMHLRKSDSQFKFILYVILSSVHTFLFHQFTSQLCYLARVKIIRDLQFQVQCYQSCLSKSNVCVFASSVHSGPSSRIQTS